MSTKCPHCGSRKFQVVVRQMADVVFDEEGGHELIDGPYGDIEFEDDSVAICANRDCGWSGTLGEATQEDLKPYTVLLLRPDFMASWRQDTYRTTVMAAGPETALADARAEAIARDYAGDLDEFYEFHDVTDYACLLLVEGAHDDINPEV